MNTDATLHDICGLAKVAALAPAACLALGNANRIRPVLLSLTQAKISAPEPQIAASHELTFPEFSACPFSLHSPASLKGDDAAKSWHVLRVDGVAASEKMCFIRRFECRML